MATDLLALTVIRPPGEIGADMVVGSAQRFGGSHGLRRSPTLPSWPRPRSTSASCPGASSAFPLTRKEGRLCGWPSQTREQHIRRDKATSNICTAQVSTAMYGLDARENNEPCGDGPTKTRRKII